MCTASLEKGYHWNSAKKTNASQKKQHVRFAMKLPLFSSQKVCNDDENNDISRERQYEDSVAESAVRQQAQCTWAAPHHAANTTFNYGGGMRRVQSANASRPRGAVGAASGMNKMSHKSRSHSQESRSSRNAVYEVAPPPPPSEQLPIPQCKNTLLEIARTKSDQTDLRRMYDYATWNMYDRIVSARNKKRISEADNTDDLDALINGEGEKESSSSSSKNNDKPSSIVTTTATTSCNSSFTSSPNQAAIACKGSGIIKTSGNNIKTTATIKKVQASTSSNTTNTTSASATTTSSTQAMSTTSTYQQQASRTTSTTTTTTTTKNTTNATTQTSSLHHKLRSINKAFSSQDTDSSQGGTAATESTSTESEDSYGSSRSGCNSPATFPGFMVGRSHRTMSQGSEDDHFIFQLDM